MLVVRRRFEKNQALKALCIRGWSFREVIEMIGGYYKHMKHKFLRVSGAKFIMPLFRTAFGCFVLTINFLLATIFLWTVPQLDDSSEVLFVRLVLTGMFIFLGLIFCIIGVKRLSQKK